MKYIVILIQLLSSATFAASNETWNIGDNAGQPEMLMGHIITFDSKKSAIGSWAILYPSRYGDHPTIGIMFKTWYGEDAKKCEGNPHHKQKPLGMRLTKIVDTWVKLNVSCVAIPREEQPSHTDYYANYHPQTLGDLNALIKLFIVSNSVAVQNFTYSAKNFRKTYNTYADRLGYTSRYKSKHSQY